MSGWFTSFLNCRLCVGGKLVEDQLVVSDDTGLILPRTGYIGGDAVDLEEGIIAPGLLELHTNGLLGFHFTHFTDEQEYAAQIDKAAEYLVTQGVTGFWATVPTVSSDKYKKVDMASFRSSKSIHIFFVENICDSLRGYEHCQSVLALMAECPITVIMLPKNLPLRDRSLGSKYARAKSVQICCPF